MASPEKKDFIGYLNTLKRVATSQPIYNQFTERKDYYEGKVRPVTVSNKKTDPVNFYNIIKPIIETKATIALDNQITTNVKAASLSQSSLESIEEIDTIAEILNDVWDNVKIKTDMPSLQQTIVRDGLIYGLGIAKASWDNTKEDGLGNVTLKRISPQDFFPEPQATSIENANYIFVRRVVSRFDLINQYKGNKKIIDKLSKLSAGETDTKDVSNAKQSNVVASFENTTKAGQTYLQENSFLPQSSKQNIEIWECYLKDDTVFVAQKDDSTTDKQVKKKQIFKYPHGRLIVYSGNQILEDKALDYPFGFPFSIFQPTKSDKMVGYSDVADLMQVQARLCDAYMKLTTLLKKYKSLLLVSKDSIPPNTLEKDFDIVYTNPGPQNPPILISNKLTADISIVRQHIQDLKQDALKLARINEIMLSGERPVGVNSGKMVQDLIESPMASIREIQRNFKNFLVDISNKGLSLIQLYYNQPRIMRISGERIASLNVDVDGNSSLDILDKTDNPVQTILNDFSITQYEIEIQTGSAMPQSQQALASITLQLAKDGIFGDINNPDIKELILKTLDYPNYQAIIRQIKEEQEEMAQTPTEPQFEDYLKNINISLKDITQLLTTMDPQSRYNATNKITDALGLTKVPAPMPEMPIEEVPIEENINIDENQTTYVDF